MKRNITKLIITKLIVVASLFCSYSFIAFSQAIVSFETITQALNYAGDRDAVKKLIITGTISGNDYSATSEWSKFRTIDTTFPNIEEVEILTSQDIPDTDIIEKEGEIGFFFYFDYDIEPIGCDWLKRFSAPNVKKIGFRAFEGCENLLSVNFPLVTEIEFLAFYGCENLLLADFPLVTTIGISAFGFCRNLSSVNFPLVTTIKGQAFEYCQNLSSINFPLATIIEVAAFAYCQSLSSVNFPLVTEIWNRAFNLCVNLSSVNFPLATRIGYSAFGYCQNLPSINFPLVTRIEDYAFRFCRNLTSATFGTGFTTPTTIWFFSNSGVFGSGDTLTKNIDLVLGENVLPEPDLNARTWQTDRMDVTDGTPYVWKSITIKTSSIEELVRNSVINIFPNPTSVHFTISFELEKSCNMKIILCDVLGQELAQVYDGFTSEGLFIRTFNTEHLAKGVYFLKILLDGNIIVEKIVVE